VSATPPSIETLLEEFESLSLDDKVYLVLRSEEDLEVCIHFLRPEAPRCWAIWYKLSQDASRQQCGRSHFPAVLRAFRVPEGVFIAEMSTRLLTQAAYADEFVRSVGELLGVEAVRESIRSTQNFMDSLKEMVRRTLRPGEEGSAGSEKPAVNVRHPSALRESKAKEGAPASGSAGKGHLRVIRNPGSV